MRRWTRLALLAVGLASLACAGGGTTDEEEDPGLFEDKDVDDDGFDFDEDCNDNNASINPTAAELCDPADVDEDCDGLADSADDNTIDRIAAWKDADLDGYGDAGSPTNVCELTTGYVGDDGDCDDADPSINPGVIEVCDDANTDEDCDGLEDDADEDVNAGTFTSWYRDADDDDFGDAREAEQACDEPAGYAEADTDCDDDDDATNPDALEVWYDGVDADCSGGSDYDRDRDGYDSDEYDGEDCDDRAPAVYPGASDTLYDGVDANCSGDTDYDADRDGHDSDAYGGDDCDDTDASTYYGAYESGTDGDTNCDGRTRATPMAVASHDRADSLNVCETIRLDGTGSSDPSGGALTYAWELVSVPSGAPETTEDITEFDDAEPTFAPTVAGDYSFALVVTNTSTVSSLPDTLTLTVDERASNLVPVASAGTDQSDEEEVTCTGEAYTASACDDCADMVFTLVGTASSDADGDALTYTWAVSSGTGTLSATDGGTTTLTIPGASTTDGGTTTSTVVVTLTVADCYGGTATDSVTLTAECTGA